MAARPYWKGQIRLALASIPVEIYSAAKSRATIAFNQIHEPSGQRIKYERVVPGIATGALAAAPIDTAQSNGRVARSLACYAGTSSG